jgi:hypothetical protein
MFKPNVWNGLPSISLKPGIQDHFPTFLNNFSRIVCNLSKCPWYGIYTFCKISLY